MTCTTPGCKREAARGRYPEIVFAHCWEHTARLLAGAFSDSPNTAEASPGRGRVQVVREGRQSTG